jgi:hypothetical protein
VVTNVKAIVLTQFKSEDRGPGTGAECRNTSPNVGVSPKVGKQMHPYLA